MLYKQPSPFLEYLSNKYHDKFMSEVLRYLLAHRSLVESKLSDRAYLKYINLEDLDYQFVRLEDKSNLLIMHEPIWMSAVSNLSANQRMSSYQVVNWRPIATCAAISAIVLFR